MPENDPILQKADELIRSVRQLIANPADRAALRHSLGRGPDEMRLDVHRIIVPHLPKAPVDTATERAFYAVPAYVAEQSRDARDEEASAGTEANGRARRRNLGAALAYAARDKGLNENSIEARLQLLARQDLDGLHRQLPRLILYLRSNQVRIDWALLIRDLARWGRYPKQVAKEWMQSYYRTSEELIAGKKRADAAAAAAGSEEK